MPVPTPTCPLALPSFTELRGPLLVANDGSGSSISAIPTTYIINDVCDNPSQYKFNAGLSLIQLGGVTGCEKVPAANVTISGRVPVCATPADIDLIVNKVRDKIKEAFTTTP